MGLICSTLCCLGQCAWCACSASRCCGSTDKKDVANQGRCGSLTVMVLAMILSLACQYYLGQRFDYYAFEKGCGGSSSEKAACMGVAGTYRVSLVTALFFFVLAGVGHVAPDTHDLWWGFKFWGWCSGLVVAWFVPNPLFFGYIWVARVGAFLFVILQQVLLIDLAYYVNDSLVVAADRGTETECCGVPWPLIVLLSMSFFCFAVAIAGIALLFAFFGTACESPNVVLGLTVVLVVAAVVVVVVVVRALVGRGPRPPFFLDDFGFGGGGQEDGVDVGGREEREVVDGLEPVEGEIARSRTLRWRKHLTQHERPVRHGRLALLELKVLVGIHQKRRDQLVEAPHPRRRRLRRRPHLRQRTQRVPAQHRPRRLLGRRRHHFLLRRRRRRRRRHILSFVGGVLPVGGVFVVFAVGQSERLNSVRSVVVWVRPFCSKLSVGTDESAGKVQEAPRPFQRNPQTLTELDSTD